MICPVCNRRMKTNGTYRGVAHSTVHYACFGCGHKEKVRTEMEEADIRQARISISYEDFAQRFSRIVANDPLLSIRK